jgi:hypothetical protein
MEVIRGVLVGLVLMLTAGLLAACGGDGSPSPAAAATTTCNEVSAALSDGPDPGADPVGYALAQVLPLEHLSTNNHALKVAIDRLADAYDSFYRADGKGAGPAAAVASAARGVNHFCPGVVSP